MLKPKKNITKKDIQKDPLLETIDKFQAKVEKNKQFYSKIIICLLSILILISFLVRNNQINKLKSAKALRDKTAVQESLKSLKKVAKSNKNIMPTIINCVKSRCTLGEISDVLRLVFGEYK